MSISKLGKGSLIRRLANTITGGSPTRMERVVNSSEPGSPVPSSSPDYSNPGTETLVYRQFNGSSSINFSPGVTKYTKDFEYNPVHSRSVDGFDINDSLSVGTYIVAGGGSSSGQKRTGGGGAGGVHYIPHSDSLNNGTMRLNMGQTYPISVGGGGGNSTFNGYTSTRGGTGGQGNEGPHPGGPGGSGGGAGSNDGRGGGGGGSSGATNNRGVPNDPTRQGYNGGPGPGGNGGGQGGSAAQNGTQNSNWNPGISAYGVPVAIGGGGGPSSSGGNGSNPARGAGRQGAGDGTGASGGGTGGTVLISFLRSNS